MNSENTKSRFKALGGEGRKAIRKQWGKVHRRNFYCVYVKNVRTPYYIEITNGLEELSPKYKALYISDVYGCNKADILRLFKVAMYPCLHNWHPNIWVDRSYQSEISKPTFVMTLAEQKRLEANSNFDETKIVYKAEMEVA